MSYSFDKNASDGDTVTLANGITYQYNASKDRWDTLKYHDDGASGGDTGGNDLQSHLKLYRNMKVQGKHYGYNNYNEIPAESNCLNMTYTSFKSTAGFITRDLDAWFPRDQYDFVPGMVTVLEPYVSPFREWELEAPVVVWVFWAGEVKEWSATRQRIQGAPMWWGNAKNQNEYPSTEFGFNYQVNFQCFRKK